MLPEVRVLVERAMARRVSLEGLLDALPEHFWERVAPGEVWSIRQQVAHIGHTDEVMALLLAEARDGRREVWVGGTDDAREFLEVRSAAVMRAGELGIDELRAIAVSSREQVVEAVSGLENEHLEAGIRIAAAVDRWGVPVLWSLREYLAAWTAHDPEHETSIRAAMVTAPDLSTVALTQRTKSREQREPEG